MSEDIPLVITNTIPVKIDLVVLSNEIINNNILYGIVTDNVTLLPIEGVNVQLYKLIDGVKTLIKSTSTIADGEYILDNIVDGDYTVSYNKSGYQTVELAVNLSKGIKLAANQVMVSIIGQINNTVSGIIKDSLGNVVTDALVALYKIENNTETLVATTYTNNLGKYMFGNVVDGNYLIKSNFNL